MRTFLLSITLLFSSVIGFSQQQELIVMLEHDANIKTVLSEVASNVQISYNRNLAPSLNTHLLTVSANLEDAMALLKQCDGVQIVQPNQHNIVLRATTPNDVDYSSQWSLSSNAPGRAFAPEAWDYTTGGTTARGDEIVVAVIDDGFDLNHEDVEYYSNSAEIPGDGIDNDLNGYVDDVNGWNAYASNGNVTFDSHGQHVAGIIGAKGNNVLGVSGVNWDVSILPISGSSSNQAVVIEAYGYAHALRKRYNETNGAEGAFVVVTNASFGVDFGNPDDYPLWCAFYDSLGAQGILSCGATANLGIDVDAYGDVPTACSSDYLIAVTNSTITGEKYSGAGYGATTIDIAAPGTNVYNTLPYDNYGSLTGTSMATPHVAGAVALMYAAMCEKRLIDFSAKPDELALAVRDSLLQHGTTPIASLTSITTTGGILNLQKCVESMRNYDCVDLSYVVANDDCGKCEGEIEVGSSTGITQFDWPATLSASGAATIANVCAGEYVVTLTDVNGFTGYDTISVVGTQPVDANETITNSYNPSGNGSILTAATGGTPPYSYAWSNGSTLSEISDLQPGDYTVTITDANGCSITETFSVASTLSAAENAQNNGFSVFPNPANRQVTIVGSEYLSTIEVFQLNGALLKMVTVNGSAQSTTFSIEELSTGFYWLTLTNLEGEKTNIKLIKH